MLDMMVKSKMILVATFCLGLASIGSMVSAQLGARFCYKQAVCPENECCQKVYPEYLDGSSPDPQPGTSVCAPYALLGERCGEPGDPDSEQGQMPSNGCPCVEGLTCVYNSFLYVSSCKNVTTEAPTEATTEASTEAPAP